MEQIVVLLPCISVTQATRAGSVHQSMAPELNCDCVGHGIPRKVSVQKGFHPCSLTSCRSTVPQRGVEVDARKGGHNVTPQRIRIMMGPSRPCWPDKDLVNRTDLIPKLSQIGFQVLSKLFECQIYKLRVLEWCLTTKAKRPRQRCASAPGSATNRRLTGLS